MNWYSVIDKTTGVAVSFASVRPDKLPANLEIIEVARQPTRGERWDPETRSVVATGETKPPTIEDKLDQVLSELAAIRARLDATPGRTP